MASQEILQSLAKAVTDKPPFCTGIFPMNSEDSTLYYKQGSTTRWLDLSQATDPQLEALAQACAPATFDRNDEDVLDESYRKAGKMDRSDFSIMLNIQNLGIIDRIMAELLDAADSDKIIKAELYKLNVYGQGSFFKSHKDTPRGETMFGSLVIVFPTPHDGGASPLEPRSTPSIAYIAFYSDIDHEVTLVNSGYRITITYNLFFESKEETSKIPDSIPSVAPDDHLLRDALSVAFNDPSFMPEGGYLGFGLSFQYPIDNKIPIEARRAVSSVFANALKGSDAMIYRVCKAASLSTRVNAVYNIGADRYWQRSGPGTFLVLVSIGNILWNGQYEDDIVKNLCKLHNGKVVHEFGKPEPFCYLRRSAEYYSNVAGLAWVIPLTKYSRFDSPYTAYGNEARSACVYADLCIPAELGPYGGRETLSGKVEKKTEQGK